MIINNFSPIDLKVARELTEEIVVDEQFEKVYFNDALKKVIAEDIISRVNIPNFDKSPLDGYAFREEDVVNACKENPVVLEVIDVIMAGDVSEKSISNGQAVRIMTGAKVPTGANCIVRYEDTEFTEKEVKIFAPIGKNKNIIRTGEDVRKGDVIIKRGTLITPAEVGVLASLGIPFVNVYKSPVVSVFATGSELLDVTDEMEDGKIRNSNSYTIEQLAKMYDVEVIQYGKVDDDLDTLVDMYKKALRNTDIVISTGGISVGDSDFVLTALDKVGVKTIFSRVMAKPGGHVFFGEYEGKYVFALSGNPAASFMNFYLYVRPLILKLQNKNVHMLKVQSKLLNGFNNKGKVSRILRANTYYQDGKFYTEIEERQASGVLSTMVSKNSIVVMPSQTEYSKGDIVEVEFLYEK